jgi:ketosteroid isomerase-like protein
MRTRSQVRVLLRKRSLILRNLRLAFLLLFSLPLFAADAIDPEVLVVREAAWRAWFGGDEAALRAMLPDEFLGISASGEEIAGRDKTIASSRAFRETGGKLLALSFPETRAQRFGDTVVLYGSYDVTILSGGAEKQWRGKLTEVFIKRDGRWVHPGWHLDVR